MVAAEAQWVPDLSRGREFSLSMRESLEKVRTNDYDILVEIELYNSEPVFLFDLFGLWPTFQLG